MLKPLALAFLLVSAPVAAQDSAPLPDASTLLKEVIDNLDKVQAGRDRKFAVDTVTEIKGPRS